MCVCVHVCACVSVCVRVHGCRRPCAAQTLYRQMDGLSKKKYDTYVIVTHGLFSRLLLMRYFRWSVDFFNRIGNLKNCEVRC